MTWLDLSKNQQFAILALVGVSFLGLAYGGIRNSKHAAVKNSTVEISDRNGDGVDIVAPASNARSRRVSASLVVHVAGCVKKTGVYVLKPGARVVDAIHAAGGPTADANLDGINLAARAKDAEQIVVPSNRAASASVAASIRPTAARTKSSPVYQPSADGMVNINTAGMDELDQLPGVGPATAQKILDYRNQIGQFSSVDQLEEVKGIGPKKLEKMRPFIRL